MHAPSRDLWREVLEHPLEGLLAVRGGATVPWCDTLKCYRISGGDEKDICKNSASHAQRLTSVGSSQYARDMTSHLPQISGCRIEPGVQGRGPFEVAYLQLYGTDKSITYRPDQGHAGKFVTCNDVVKGKANTFIDGLYSLYLNAIDNNNAEARMEVRVPIQFALQILLDMDVDVICQGLVSFPSVEWWYALSITCLSYFANDCLTKEFTCLPREGHTTGAPVASRGSLEITSDYASTPSHRGMRLANKRASFGPGQWICQSRPHGLHFAGSRSSRCRPDVPRVWEGD
jgi:hypothetical protein